ncbi:MAG: hypothetical protein K2O18_10360 [Oscillospiraceae bacterium]|nr:hypothetical protein [Oscillospiraceae bacterium]
MSQYIDQEHLNQIQNILKGVGLTADEERTIRYLSIEETYTVRNIVSIIAKARQAGPIHSENIVPQELTQKDLLTTWGYLESLKNIYERKARESAQRGDDTGRSLTADYMRQSAEISAMQRKLDREAGTE